MPRDVPGAVVVGGDFHGLGVVRSLGRRGIPTCVIDDEWSISRFSRYATRSARTPDLRDESATVESLLAIGERLGLAGWVLYPTRDETVAAVAKNRATLSQLYRVPTPEWETVRWAWDKRYANRLAERLGIPIPRTWFPRDERDLSDIPTDRPLVLKPAFKGRFFYETKAKAWQTDGRSELVERFKAARALAGPRRVMVQELIEGQGERQFSYCAFFKEGRAVATVCVGRRRQHPPDFGRCSTRVETLDLPAIETHAERFLAKIGYYGLAEVEFKQDPRDDLYKLLDVNARTWASHSIGARAGVDFAALLYADQVGLPVTPSRGRPGVTWIRLVTDIPTGIHEVFHRRLGLWSYARSIGSFDIESVFSRDDLRPGLAELALVPYLVLKRGF